MKGYSIKSAAIAIGGITLAIGSLAFKAQADQWDRKTIMTIDRPMQVTNTYLEPGTYVLKLRESDVNRHIVQIFNSDQSRVIDTVQAIPNWRLRPTDKSEFTFYETPPGSAPALRAWFYPGDLMGQEFRYPTELRQIAYARPAATQSEELKAQALIEPTPAPALVDRAEVQPAPAPVAQQQQETRPAEEPVVIAQNNAPQPEPSFVAQNNTPAPTPTPQSTPSELPQTASVYPWIGITGLVSLALYGLLRLTRV